ncbi:MAG: glycosyltransferase family 39 protein [Alphaproteobacteria bacterium]|nr:glycosyltransferase family 39 protein [Alphaproteobacteria bacterium]
MLATAWVVLEPLLTVGLVALAALAVGGPLVDRATVSAATSRAERTAAGFLVGLAALGLVVLALGLAGVLHRTLVGLLLAGLAVEGGVRAWRGSSPDDRPRLAPGLAGWAALAVLAAHLPKAFIPDFRWDSLVYHLTLPRTYLREAAITAQPWGFNGLMPHNLELTYVLALLGDQLVAARLLALAVVTAGLVLLMGCASRLGAPALGGVAALLALASPDVQHDLATTYTEGGMGAYLVLALWGVLGLESTRRGPGLVLVGATLGWVMGCKYTTWIYVAPVGLGAAWVAARAEPDPRGQLRDLGLLAGSALAVLAPWLVRSAALTGNPVWPNAHGLFGGRWWSPILAHQLHGKMSYHGRLGEEAKGSAEAALALPWDLVMDPRAVYTPKGWSPALVVLFLLSPLALTVLRGRWWVVVPAAWLGFWTFAFLPVPNEGRYLLPLVPILALAAAAPLAPLLRWRVAAPLARLGALAAYLAQAQAPPLEPAVFTPEGKAARLARNDGARWAPALEALLPADAKVAFLFENKLLFWEHPAWADTLHDAPSSFELLRTAGSAEAMARTLREAGITHLVLNPRNARVYLQRKVPTALTHPTLLPDARFAEEVAMFRQLLAEQAEPVGTVEGREVYRLR